MQVEHMTWQEYAAVIEDGLVILPVGSLEQHGPHLPLNVDVVIPTGLARLVAGQTNGMVLPAIVYGYKSQPTSGGGQLFPGTTSLDGTTLISLVRDILRETHRHGGRKFLIFNGHFENSAFLTEAVDLFMRDADGVKVVILSWWDQVSDAMIEELFAGVGFPGWNAEHAALTETALMQYFAPEWVRDEKIIDDQADRKPTYSVFPAPDDMIPASGVLYKATHASPEKGERLAGHIVDAAVAIARREFAV